MKGLEDDKVSVTSMLKFVLERIENILGKKEKMLVTQHYG